MFDRGIGAARGVRFGLPDCREPFALGRPVHLKSKASPIEINLAGSDSPRSRLGGTAPTHDADRTGRGLGRIFA